MASSAVSVFFVWFVLCSLIGDVKVQGQVASEPANPQKPGPATCRMVSSRNEMNPVTLSLSYCKNSVFRAPSAPEETVQNDNVGNLVEVLDKESIFEYKLTDIHSNLEYLFNAIYLVKENSGIEEDYKFLTKSPRFLAVHQRTIPGEDAFSRYFIISQTVQESQNEGTKNAALKSILEENILKASNVTFKLNSIFPSYGIVNRYDMAGETSCADAFVFIDFVQPVNVSKTEFSTFQKLAITKWNPGRIGNSVPGKWNLPTFGKGETVRFDCQLPRNPNAVIKNSAASILYFQIFQFLFIAILLQSI